MKRYRGKTFGGSARLPLRSGRVKLVLTVAIATDSVIDHSQVLTNTSISSHMFAYFVILSLKMFWTTSLHLRYLVTFSKLIPHEPYSCLSCQLESAVLFLWSP